MTLTLGYSPCPNDTFIFHALVHGLVKEEGLSFTERLEDVETLNRLVLAGGLDVSKVSFHLFGHVRDDYVLLRGGGALGRGCGPLLIARTPVSPQALRGKKVALPGRYTTACLLLRLFAPELDEIVFLPFHEIVGAVSRGEVAAGVIIHESRFTFREHGLVELVDLGAWWERETGHPIPLGGIVARRTLGTGTVAALNRAVRASVRFAFDNPARARDYIRAHSQEMSEEICAAHIALYVNSFSVDLGDQGEQAVSHLLGRAEALGLIPSSRLPLCVP